MSEPATPATAIAKIDKQPTNAFRRWQERNRARRDISIVSDFIYWTHKHTLGLDDDIAMRAAIRADPDDYLAAFAGMLAFPILGLPLRAIKLAKKMHSKIYYGE